MEGINRLEESTALLDEDPSVDSLNEFLSQLLEESEGDLGTQIYYCKKLILTYFYGTGTQHLTDDLRQNLYDIEFSTDNDDKARLALLSVGLWYIESGDLYSVDGVVIDWRHELKENVQSLICSSEYFFVSGVRS